jgi:NADH dehydrogenase [ubiquinone] 1 alpha subcomplex assembly factor 5
VPSDAILVFDPRAIRAHRARALRAAAGEFLFDEIAERLLDRLDDIARRFSRALDLGARGGVIALRLRGRGGIVDLVELDAGRLFSPRGKRLAAEAELLPFAPASVDAVLSCLALHWVNDLPGALLQIRHALKPDGLFLAALFGGETLCELRQALLEAELAEQGGAGPRVSPFADLRDMAGLLQRAGFALPVADIETITVTYADPLALMRDLRAMGETNALIERRKSFTRRSTLLRAAALYRERFGTSDGRIPATFQVIFLAGWAPHESQPVPLRPGSARTRLADALGTTERPAGDRIKPSEGSR